MPQPTSLTLLHLADALALHTVRLPPVELWPPWIGLASDLIDLVVCLQPGPASRARFEEAAACCLAIRRPRRVLEPVRPRLERMDSTPFSGLRRSVRTAGALGAAGLRAGLSAAGVHGGGEDLARLAAAFGALKGLLAKAGQWLAYVSDVLPPTYAEALGTLQRNAPPMSPALVYRRMAAELGLAWRSRFQAFDETPVSAAFLGQAHRARLSDGRDVACKLQYPDIDFAICSDLAQVRLLAAVWRRLDGSVNPTEALEDLAERLMSETDYLTEARALRLFGRVLDGLAVVPEPVREATTRRLLAMGWLEALPFAVWAAAGPSKAERAAHGLVLFRAWYAPFFRVGAIHADPHPGNHGIVPDGRPAIYDFGSFWLFPAAFVQGVWTRREAIRRGGDMAEAYVLWGFSGLSADTRVALARWAAWVYEPLLRAGAGPMVADPAVGVSFLGDVARALRNAGGVRPPREFPLFDRAALGLGVSLWRLGAQADWGAAFEEMTLEGGMEGLAERQGAAWDVAA
jgi:hypothetical protein